MPIDSGCLHNVISHWMAVHISLVRNISYHSLVNAPSRLGDRRRTYDSDNLGENSVISRFAKNASEEIRSSANMTAIGKFAASVVSATNENNFGLANFNIDFSLVKIEAPVEYQELRSALSTRRIENAEQGQVHRTARRLGALFEQLLPAIKTLAEAYGRRASEIATSERKNHKVSKTRHSAFTDTFPFHALVRSTKERNLKCLI